MELSLTLIKLVQICVFERDPGVSFIDLDRVRTNTYSDTELVLNALDSHVLPHRPKLVVEVLIVSKFVLPFSGQHFQSFFQDWLRPNLSRVGGLRQAEVRLFQPLAGSLNVSTRAYLNYQFSWVQLSLVLPTLLAQVTF